MSAPNRRYWHPGRCCIPWGLRIEQNNTICTCRNLVASILVLSNCKCTSGCHIPVPLPRELNENWIAFWIHNTLRTDGTHLGMENITVCKTEWENQQTMYFTASCVWLHDWVLKFLNPSSYLAKNIMFCLQKYIQVYIFCGSQNNETLFSYTAFNS